MRIIFMSALLLGAGSAAAIVHAQKSGGEAQVTVVKGYDKGSGLGTGTAQFYDYAPDNRCWGRKRISKFSFITGKEKTKPVPAGEPIVFSAYTNRYTSAGTTSTDTGPIANVNTATCANRASFTPQSGARYVIMQKVEIGKSCTISVTDKSTGAAPADLQLLAEESCTKK